LRGYYRSICAFLSVGFDVVADLGLYTEAIASAFAEETQSLTRLVVGVHWDLDELDRREQLRGNRPIGLGRNQSAKIHRHVRYDIEVDTSDGDLMRCADIVIDALN
jgi:chloramphenicol 3-O phosphotransferase